VEFRLLYEGELPPSGNNNKRPREKHEIRRRFHPQLRRLWSMESNLRELAARRWLASVNANCPPTTDPERFDLGIKAMGEKWVKAGYECVPLVTSDMDLRCGLDILLLRPEEDRFIFQSGDVDGQLKTLFDALRIPQNPEETGRASPLADECPLFCLLEDDRLISDVRVNTDRLLLLPGQRAVKPNDAFVVIHVTLNHRPHRTFDNYFG
jgi:hypothetical protein